MGTYAWNILYSKILPEKSGAADRPLRVRSFRSYTGIWLLVELTRTWTWKSGTVAIFLLFLTLWHVLTYKQADATLASLSILKYEALKWPHRVIRGSKIKSASILFKSMSYRRPWLKNSKNVIIFQMRHVVLTLGVVKGQRLVFRWYRGPSKN